MMGPLDLSSIVNKEKVYNSQFICANTPNTIYLRTLFIYFEEKLKI